MAKIRMQGKVDVEISKKEVNHLGKVLGRVLNILVVSAVLSGSSLWLGTTPTVPSHVPEGGNALYAQA